MDWAGLHKRWEELAFRLTSSAQILTVEDLEAASGDSGFLPTFADIMQQSSILRHFQSDLTEWVDPPSASEPIYISNSGKAREPSIEPGRTFNLKTVLCLSSSPARFCEPLKIGCLAAELPRSRSYRGASQRSAQQWGQPSEAGPSTCGTLPPGSLSSRAWRATLQTRPRPPPAAQTCMAPVLSSSLWQRMQQND